MDLSKFYVLFALCQKSKLKFDQDSKACWNFCFEQKVLNEKLMPNKLLNLCLGHFVNQKGAFLTPIEMIHHYWLWLGTFGLRSDPCCMRVPTANQKLKETVLQSNMFCFTSQFEQKIFFMMLNVNKCLFKSNQGGVILAL